jgi:enamine deaminase RidA (YjgF/YER057c/UK114 family)
MTQTPSPEAALTALGLALPQLPVPGGNVRAAVGVSALPRNALVEIQMTVRVAE